MSYVSPAITKTVDKALWKVYLPHLLLCRCDIVTDAVAQYGLSGFIIQCVSCSGVTVPWLSDSAGVNDQPAPAEYKVLFGRKYVSRAMFRADLLEGDGHMGVPDETIRCLESGEVGHGPGRTDKVLPYRLPRTAVDEGKKALFQPDR